MVLHIFDISNALYAGLSSQFYVTRGVHEVDGQWEARKGHVGAIKFTLKILREAMGPNSVVIPVMERVPTIKREMYYELTGEKYGYKAGRKAKPPHFDETKDYLEVVLRDLGFPVQYAEGYEADDFIYTLVELYKYDFEKIYVHTKDSDLFFLVSENVEIAKVGDKGKEIDLYNYEHMVRKGYNMLYNTIHLSKLYNGDKSDNIPGIGLDWVERIDSVIPLEEFPKLGDLDLCRKYLREASIKFAGEHDSHRIVPIFNLLVPLRVPNELIVDEEYDVNLDKIDNYYLAGFNAANDRWGLEDLLEDFIDKYYG